MNRKTRLAAALVAGCVLAAAAVAVAAPAIAGAGPFGHPSASTSWSARGPGAGPGTAGRELGRPPRDGGCLAPSTSAPSGTLSAAQIATLTGMAQEEKLAGDLYQAFAGRYPAVVFDRIAAAEDQHLDAVRTLLTRYGLSDPTAGEPAGRFSTATVQATFDRLSAEGAADQSAAFGVGQQVERTDIADLQRALGGLSAADVTRVYEHLLAASKQHLSAFTTWATR